MDTIGLYIHLTEPGEKANKVGGLLKVSIYKYCIRKKIASLILFIISTNLLCYGVCFTSWPSIRSRATTNGKAFVWRRVLEPKAGARRKKELFFHILKKKQLKWKLKDSKLLSECFFPLSTPPSKTNVVQQHLLINNNNHSVSTSYSDVHRKQVRWQNTVFFLFCVFLNNH